MNYYFFTNRCTNLITFECNTTDADAAWIKLRDAIDLSKGLGLSLPHGQWVIQTVSPSRESTNG